MELRKSARVHKRIDGMDSTKLSAIKTNFCVLCGNNIYDRELKKQSKLLKRQKLNHCNALCRLLEISSTRFLSLFKNRKYCDKCYKNIQKFTETFSTLDRMVQEISEWKFQVEELLLNNFNTAKHSCKEIFLDGLEEIVNEISYRRTNSSQLIESSQLESHVITEEGLSATTDEYCATNEVVFDTDSCAYEELDSSSSDAEEDIKYGQKKSRTRTTNAGNHEFKCSSENCKKTFSTEDRMRQHIRAFHKMEHKNPEKDQPRIIKCDLCDAVGVETIFETRKARKEHRSKDELHPLFKNGVYTCDICSKSLTDIRGIKNHRRNHKLCDLTERNCPTCALRLPTGEELLSHMELHKSETPFQCVLCLTILISSVDLKRHMVLYHADAVGVIHRSKCEVPGCEKTFKNAHDLRRHLLKHQGQGLIKCKECDVYVDSESQLKLHMISHSDEKKFQCDVCGDHLKYMKGLKRHKRRHEIANEGGKFKYECKICSKSFESTQRLRRHEEIHSGCVNLCDICGKSFSAKQNLVQHYKTHFKDMYPPVKRDRVKKSKQSNVQSLHQQEKNSGGELLMVENFAQELSDNVDVDEGGNEIANAFGLQTMNPFCY